MKRTLGDRLAQARRELGVREWRDVRRREIAEAAGVDPSTITLYEQGKSNVGEDVLALLARFFGTTPALLRYGPPESQPVTVDRGTIVAGRGAPTRQKPSKEA